MCTCSVAEAFSDASSGVGSNGTPPGLGILEPDQISLTSLASSVDRVGVACLLPSLTPLFPSPGSVWPIRNNYLQKRGWRGDPVQQIPHLCLLAAVGHGPLLIQPSPPNQACKSLWL